MFRLYFEAVEELVWVNYKNRAEIGHQFECECVLMGLCGKLMADVTHLGATTSVGE